jgi:hypothetical protein
MDHFIPSLITPGKHFSISIYKPQRGPALATSTEGTREDHGNGFIGFSFMLFEARGLRTPLTGPNTVKNRMAAMRTLINELIQREWISLEDGNAFLATYRG